MEAIETDSKMVEIRDQGLGTVLGRADRRGPVSLERDFREDASLSWVSMWLCATFHHLAKVITRTQNILHCFRMLLVPGPCFWALWEELGLVAKRVQGGHGVSLFRSGTADLELHLHVPD